MSKLAQILEDQLAEANAKAGTRILRRLARGLRVEMVSCHQKVIITLARDNQFPSIQEWDTVIKHFPYNTPLVMPAPEQKNGRYTITATVPARRVMQLKFG